MTAPVLDTYALQYGATGILLNGAPLADGTVIDVVTVSGLDSAPAKSSTASSEGQDGGITNAVFEDQRPITITGMLYEGSIPAHVTLEAMKANFAVSDTAQPLYFQQHGTTLRMVNCKALGLKYDWTTALRTGTSPFSASLVAEDPTIYGTSLYSIPGSLILASTQGYSYPHGYPYSYGANVLIGTTLLPNIGTRPAGFKATIQNQSVVNPRIVCDTFSTFVSTNLTIGSSDVLVFDFYTQSLYLNGVSRHASIVNEGWFKLAASPDRGVTPGYTSVRFLADSTTAANINYNYYDAYR